MKKNQIRTALLLLAAPFVLGACHSNPKPTGSDEQQFQFMTYNVRNGLGMDEVKDLNRVVEVIRKQQPDVVAMQEIDSVTERSGGKYVLGVLAQQAHMHATFAPAIDFQGGKYGVGMLSKEKPMGVKTVALPGREEKRTLLVVEFEKFVYACTHLSLTPEDQLLSLPIIQRLTGEYKKPVLIAGDLNAHPDSETIRGLQKSFLLVSPTDVKTYPADVPTETIDYIAIHHKDTARVKAVSTQVLNEPRASDHRPIVASISIR